MFLLSSRAGMTKSLSKYVRLTMVLLVCFAIASCNPKKNLSAEEVLRRAILRGHTMDSASLSASVSASVQDGTVLSGSSVIQAVLQNGGTSWSVTSTFQATGTVFKSEETSGRITVLTMDGRQFFVKADGLQGMVADLMKQAMTGSLNGWWVTGQSQSGQIIRTVRSAPAPAELNAATAMFVIVDSTAPRRGQDGRLEHRLDVRLSKEAQSALFTEETTEMATMEGTLFIDAEEFTLRRSSWTIENLMTPFGPTALHFDISLQDFDRAPDVLLPQGSSATLPLKDIFATFSF